MQPAIARILPASATLSDKATVSLLTVYPRDKAVYAIFGHTAVRVCDPEQDIDLVYNYGFFDSSKPNFIYHFVKGETDYILGVEDFNDFLFDYSRSHAAVDEQILGLSPEEKTSIFNFLNTNALPENREYRYDYFFDNCTTRPRDIIEKTIQGKLVYPEQERPVSLRDLVHRCTYPYPWLSFGIDLVIGSGADSTIMARQELFLPVKLLLALDKAKVRNDTASYALVAASRSLMESEDKNISVFRAENAPMPPFLHTPMFVNGLILLMVIGMTILGYVRKRRFRGMDFLLFFMAGTAGCIVCFICFVSTHPCTSYNINVLWLHPLHLLAAVLFLANIGQKLRYWYHLINFALLTLFLVSWHWLPQYVPGDAIPLVLCLWIRSGAGLKSRIATTIFVKQKLRIKN
jgi:hypothetical protein